MKKLRLVIAFCVVIVLAGGTVAMRRRATSGVMPDLKPYAVSDKTLYFDPSAFFKSMPAGSIPPGASLDPMEIRYMKIKNVSFDKINEIVHHDLTAKDRWHFAPSAIGSRSSMSMESIEAYQGVIPTSPLGEPDHVVMVIPDYSSGVTDWNAIKPGVLPKPKAFLVMEMHKMPPWEATWLKVKNFRHDPFSSQQQLMSAFTP